MIAKDVADMYLPRRKGESVADVLQAVRRCAGLHGWVCEPRACSVPAFLPPLGEGDYLGVVLEPLPPAAIFEYLVGGMVGEGRDVRLPYFDALLREWCLSGTEWGFAQRGLSVHDLFDAHVRMAGSYFALMPNLRPNACLYFGRPQSLAKMVRAQTLWDRGDVLVFERIELHGHDKALNADGPMLVGTLSLTTAPEGSIVAVVEDGKDGCHRLVKEAFIDLATARSAWACSNELPSRRVLFARQVWRESLM